MKKLLLLHFLLINFLSYSQITSLPSSNALSLTKFSDASVNESSGRLVQSVPLYEYKSGRLRIPIELFYSGNAVKVVQQSGWVGTNWSLNAGGVVTRIVNDIADEKASQRVFFDEILNQGDSLQGHLYVKDALDLRDFRADLFSYSFPGFSGSFYLDEYLIPRLTDNNSELKIEFVGGLTNSNDNIILITTPYGDKYFFGGVNASERSSSLVSVRKKNTMGYLDGVTYSEINTVVSPEATTAFYLFKVENIFGDQILIDYDDNGTKNFVMYEQQELPKFYEEPSFSEGCLDLENFTQLNSSVFKISIHNLKTINKIYSLNSNHEVRFNSDNLLLPPFGTIPSPQYDGKKLNSIQIFNTLINENVKNIKFEYLLPGGVNARRFFLEKISFNNSNDVNDPKCESYRFEYNSPEDLPDRFSYEIDLLGYYNGYANTTLVGENQSINFDNNSFQNLAVRETNFEFATKGSLKKIFLPTGGYNQFEYENPHVVVTKQIRKEMSIHRKSSNYIPANKVSQTFTIGGLFEGPDQPVLTNPITQSISVFVTANVQSNGAYHHHKIIVEVKDLTTNQIVSDYLNLFTGTFSYQKIMNFPLIKDHNYHVTLKFNPESPTSQDATVEAMAVFDYIGSEFIPTLGIRIKEIKSVDEDNTVKEYKKYHYKKYSDITTTNDDSAVVTFDAKQSTRTESYCCLPSEISNSFNVVKLLANPLSYYFSGSDNQVEYRYVTISYGDEYFGAGGVEKEFKVDETEKVKQYLYGPFNVENPEINFEINNLSNSTIFNGLLIGERSIKKENNSLIVTAHKKYNYEQAVDHEIKCFTVLKTFNGCVLPDDEFVGNPAIGYYSIKSFSNKLVSTIVNEYLDPALPNNTLTSINEFEYGTLRGMPVKSKSIDSKGNSQIVEYKFVLPTEVYSETFPVANTSAFAFMYSNNVVAFPIEVLTKYKVNGGTEKIVERKATLYRLFNGAYVTDKVMGAKANGVYQNSIEYSLYDNDFNLLEITIGNQIKKSFIYGYDNKAIIAELDNISYSSIPTATINNLKYLSDNVVDDTSMNLFQNALISLRSVLPQSSISSRVYDKYSQLRISTDARNYSVYNSYDVCRRLLQVKDNSGNIIEEYKYNLNNN
jgi:hypothetical protein